MKTMLSSKPWLLCASFLLNLFIAAGIYAAEKPNIVYFLIDDLGRCDVGFMGGTEIKTPNIDKLAAAGARLDQFYVQPVCSPTRAALMTGRYPMRHGLQVGVVRPWARYGLPLEERTLPQALKDVGYSTAIVGKWHLGHFEPAYLPTHRGFDHQYGHYNGALDYFDHTRDGGFDWHRDDKVCRDEGYTTHLVAKEACRLVKEQSKDKPLLLYVPFNAVHGPYQVPEQYTAPYANMKGTRRNYAGMLAATDEAIGQIVAAIEEKGQRRNTLFIFSSDNGGPSPGVITDNGPYRAGKGTVYEGGTRVCAFATWDGHIPAGKTITQPIHIVDWFPTLVKLTGASLDQKLPLDGRDIWPVLTAGQPTLHEDILLNTTPKGGALIVGEWKVVINGSAAGDEGEAEAPAATAKKKGKKKAATKDAIELFNLAKDPYEKTNLADLEPGKLKELRSRYDAYAKQAVPPKSEAKAAGFQSPKVWGD
jgi:arylsulfatase A-like enzyme